MASYPRKYGTGTGADIYINIPKAGSANHAVSADWTPAAGDVKISKDGGAAANIGTLPTAIAMGNSTIWKFVFTDAELQAKFISVTVSDSATKAVDDTGFSIETYGNASGLHPFDLASATVTPATGSITASVIASGAIDRDAFAADTGLQSIRSNTAQAGAATTITLDASASATDDFYNGGSIYITGGTGAGQQRVIADYVGSTKVATVNTAWVTNPDNTSTFAIFPAAETSTDIAAAVLAAAAADPIAANVKEISDDATAADSLEAILDGTGSKLSLTQLAINAAGDDHAILAIGSGTGSGIFAAGGASNASGIDAVGQGTGSGISAQASDDGGSGIVAIGLGVGNGMTIAGGPDGHGIDAQGGTGGSVATHGIRGAGGSLNGCGLRGVGAPEGAGIGGLGGSTSGSGIRGAGQAGDSAGIEGQGQGSNAGLKVIGGATGHGLHAVGGASDGDGLVGEAAAGDNNGASFIASGAGVEIDGVRAELLAALQTAVEDSVPADGSRPSISQAAYMMVQFMLERSVSGTTVTVKKPDGATALFTLQLNSSTLPTSTTRST